MSVSNLSSLRLVNDPDNLLVRQVAGWLVEAGSLETRLAAAPTGWFTFWMPRRAHTAPARSGEGFGARWRRRARYVQWLVAACLITTMTVFIIRWLFGDETLRLMGAIAVGSISALICFRIYWLLEYGVVRRRRETPQ
jgi:hypothetical protein